jgi:hypothetical protein
VGPSKFVFCGHPAATERLRESARRGVGQLACLRLRRHDAVMGSDYWLAKILPYGRAVHALKPGGDRIYCTELSEKWLASADDVTLEPLGRTGEPTCHWCRRVLKLDD